MARLNIALGQRSYDILVEAGALAQIAGHIAPWTRRGRTLWISDSHVAAHHWLRVEAQLASAGVEAHLHIVPAGEASKSWSELAHLIDWLLAMGVERSDTIFALGGGMIGDLTGFAASIVKRGCDFVQVPTTLLAQVDSSVGGKTAINTTAGKNLVGTFHQPRFVLIDPQVLATLPPREMRAGYAEVVKYGADRRCAILRLVRSERTGRTGAGLRFAGACDRHLGGRQGADRRRGRARNEGPACAAQPWPHLRPCARG
jgi:3-dehydroquinate synthase